MISTLYEPFRHWLENGSVYILSDIDSIHRITIDHAGEKKEKKEKKWISKETQQ